MVDQVLGVVGLIAALAFGALALLGFLVHLHGLLTSPAHKSDPESALVVLGGLLFVILALGGALYSP